MSRTLLSSVVVLAAPALVACGGAVASSAPATARSVAPVDAEPAMPAAATPAADWPALASKAAVLQGTPAECPTISLLRHPQSDANEKHTLYCTPKQGVSFDGPVDFKRELVMPLGPVTPGRVLVLVSLDLIIFHNADVTVVSVGDPCQMCDHDPANAERQRNCHADLDEAAVRIPRAKQIVFVVGKKCPAGQP